MFKKVGVMGLIVAMIATLLVSCGGNTSEKDAQIADMQKQIEDLQQQVNQNQQQAIPQQAIPQQTIPQQQVPVQADYNNNLGQAAITMDQAKQIATTDAGVDLSAATFIKTAQDYDNGILNWEIDFVAHNVKHEYDINATTGAVMKKQLQPVAQGAVTQQAIPQTQGTLPGAAQGQGITVDQAKQIAVQEAGFDVSAVTFVKQEYDFEHGMPQWEIEFVSGTMKYEYEINASNGMVTKSKIESIYND